MKTFIISAISLFAFSCSQPERNSEVKDVVSPVKGPVKQLISNISFGNELFELYTSFGYFPGNNCFQHIKNLKTDGTHFKTIELHEGPCRNYPIKNTPVAVFRVILDNSEASDYRTFWISPLSINGRKVFSAESVGRIRSAYPYTRGGVINQLCSLHFSDVCNVYIDSLGTIKGMSLK